MKGCGFCGGNFEMMEMSDNNDTDTTSSHRNYKQTPRLASDGLDAIAKSLSTLCTGKEFGTIRYLARKLRVSFDDVSQELFDCECDLLSKSGADDVIKHLQSLLPEGSEKNIIEFPKAVEPEIKEGKKEEKETPTRLWQLHHIGKSEYATFYRQARK